MLAVDNASVRLARSHVHTGFTERLPGLSGSPGLRVSGSPVGCPSPSRSSSEGLLMRIVVLILLVALSGSTATAGPILAWARRAAARHALTASGIQPNACQVAAQHGEADGRARQGQGGWFAGGLLFSPFFIPIMPIVAHTTEPTPAADALSGIAREDLSCYTTGYVRTARGKRVRASWIGYGVSFAMWIGIVAAAAST